MLLILTVKDTDNVIGLKEDIAMRLEGVADIEQIDVVIDNRDEWRKIIQKLTGVKQWVTIKRNV